MRKAITIGAVIIGAIIAIFLFMPRGNMEQTVERVEPVQGTVPSTPEDVDFKASFSITTNGTKRIFTDAIYHELDNDVYIPSNDASTVIVKKSGITWAYFFETLPMSLDKECLVTGTSQTFCTDENNSLKFYLNDEETTDALDMEILDGDVLEVYYN